MNKDEIFIVGGGPSLDGFPFRLLQDKKTIAVNKSFLFMDNASYFITKDYTFIRKIEAQKLKNYENCTRVFVADFSSGVLKTQKGAIIDIRGRLVYENLYDFFDLIVLGRRDKPLGDSWKTFCPGNSSGYSALQLALLEGYKKIYLLGIDFKTKNNKTHFHGGYRNIRTSTTINSFILSLHRYEEYFKIAIEETKKLFPDVQIISCSQISNLNKVISYIDWKEIL